LAEDFPQVLRSFCKVLIDQDFQRLQSHGTGQRVAAVGRAMLSRLQAKHHFVISKHSGDGKQTARESFPKADDIWANWLVVDTQHLSGAA
jgi:hypothetical protein